MKNKVLKNVLAWIFVVSLLLTQTAAVFAFSESGETETGQSVTPVDGTANVIENSVKTPEEREFFTIQTDAGNIYYLVVDKQKKNNNVYLLSAVTDADLAGLAKPTKQGGGLFDTKPEEKPEPSAPQETEKSQQQSETPKEVEGNKDVNRSILLFAVLAAGGAAYYCKIYKPKKELDQAEDLEELLDDEAPTINEDDLYIDRSEEQTPVRNMDGMEQKKDESEEEAEQDIIYYDEAGNPIEEWEE